MMSNTQTEELKNRLNAKIKELESRLETLKADSRAETREAETKVKAQLDELNQQVKEGWNSLSEKTAAKLNEWLKRAPF